MSQKRSRPVSSIEEIDGREDAPREEERVLLSGDDGERTLSDLHVPTEVDVVVAESSVRRRPRIPRLGGFERAGLQLKEFILLQDEESRRAALPPAGALEDATAWPVKRIRSLAIHCKLKPVKGLIRSAMLDLLDVFREGPRELDLNGTPPPHSVDLDAQREEQPEDGREEAARLRALEVTDLLAAVEDEEREVEDAEAQAARDRVEEDEALALVHASQIQDLRGRLSAAKRAKAQRRTLPPPTPAPLRPLASPFPLLTTSRVARMDKRLPRPAEGPEGLQPAPPSPDARRPAREDAGSGLVVRVLFLFPSRRLCLPSSVCFLRVGKFRDACVGA
jgi:hypothetical protein